MTTRQRQGAGSPDPFRKHTGASAADGKAWLAGLVTSHRYLEDIWASSVPVSMDFRAQSSAMGRIRGARPEAVGASSYAPEGDTLPKLA
jgi:hypothetical protein